MPHPPANWYAVNGQWRWWDGVAWTSHVAPMAPDGSMITETRGVPTHVPAPRRIGRAIFRRTAIGATAVALVSAPVAAAQGGLVLAAVMPPQPSTVTGAVTKIVDGDTLDVRVDGSVRRVRLLNIDTPEAGQECLAAEATAALTAMAPVGSTVTLTYDISRKDKYDRDLAIVKGVNGVQTSNELARAGLGLPVMFSPNKTYFPEVNAASKEAQAAKKGLFSAEVPCTIAAQSQGVEQALAAIEAAPQPASIEDAEQLNGRAVAAVALAAALTQRLASKDAYEIRTMPVALIEAFRKSASAASARGQAVVASSDGKKQEFLAAKSKAEDDAKAAAEAAAKAQAEADAKAAADAAASEAARAEAQRQAEAAAAAEQQRRAAAAPQPFAAPAPPAPTNVYYKNCDAVRAAGAAPIYRGQPGYASHLDRDNDGVACER